MCSVNANVNCVLPVHNGGMTDVAAVHNRSVQFSETAGIFKLIGIIPVSCVSALAMVTINNG